MSRFNVTVTVSEGRHLKNLYHTAPPRDLVGWTGIFTVKVISLNFTYSLPAELYVAFEAEC